MAFDPSSIKLDGFDPDNVIDGAAPAKAEQGDYLRGLKKYVPQMQEMYGAGKALVGKAIDSEGMVQSGIETMQDANRKVEEIGSKPTDEFTNVKSVGDFADWAQHGLGQVTGNLAESLVAAGAGTLLGGALGNPITAGVGGVGGLVGKQILKKALKEQGEAIAEDQAKKIIGKKVGQNAAIAGMAGFHGVGETGSRAFQEAKYDPNQVELGQVLPRAAGHAAAEFLSDKILLGGMLGKGAYRAAGEGAYPLVKTVAGNMAIVAGKEIPVELVQTVLERDAAKLELMSPEARDEYINTAAQTMLFGIAGAPAGVRSYMAKPPQQTQPMTQEEAAADLTASNTELAGATAAYDALPSDVPKIGYNGKPDAIIVPNQSGGTTEINRNDGALSAAVVDTGITGQMLDNGTTLVPFASRDAAQAAIDQREDADRLTVVPHPRVSGRFAMVPKDRLTLEAQDQAAMRRQQLEQEDGNAPQLDEAGSQGRGSVAGGGGGNASAVSGIGAGSGDAAASSVPGRGTSMAMGASDATESALALESAQSELAPQSAQPVSSMPGVQARNAERIAAARIAAEARGTALVDEEAAAANTAPSEAQIAAGNYKKGHIKVGPLDISVENPIGSTRSGKEGKKSWTTTMRAHYGYIKRTVGADGDQIDVFVKEGTPADHSGTVYVIDQFNPKTGRFDEHKGMIGYSSQADAARAYDDHFGDKSGPKRRKAVIGMPAATFARWAKEGDTTSPISQSGRTADEAQAEIEKSTGKLSPSRQKAAGRDPYAVAQEANDRRSERTTGMPEQDTDNTAVARTIGATDFEEVKDEALPDAKDTDAPGTLTKQGAKSLRMLAKLFGKKIVIFKTDADADGFYINGNTIYIKSDSSVSQLRVLGHEMMHALRRQAPKVYQQMLDAVSELLTDAELKAFYADYNNGKTMPAEMSAEQRDALVEEWMADLGGNRWGEAEFWSSMFSKLEEQHGTTLAKKIINQLRMAVVKVINSLLRTIRGGAMFAVDRRMADNLEKIREAMAQGFADYAKVVKDGQVASGTGGVKFARGTADQTLPTRWPTSKKVEASVNDDMITDLATLKLDQKQYKKAVDAIIEEPGMHSADMVSGTVDEKADHVIKRMVSNLLWLYDQVPQAIQERSKLWYDGARKIAESWSKTYDITESQAAGALAVLSPQKDWFMNVTMAERVLDIIHTKMDHRFDKRMDAAAFGFLTKDSIKDDPDSQKNLNAYKAVKGKTLRQVAAHHNLREMSVWIRAYDEAYHDPKHAIVTPEGGFVEDKTTVKGEPTLRAWGDFNTPGKAASIYLDGSPENINKMLGSEHKVRNFYNNIYAPNDARFTTIDTHAVAADMLRPLAGADKPVAENFGKTGGTNVTGLSGTYALHYEAYRQAAEARGVLPREMQSITWEAVRGLFTEGYKGKKDNVRYVDSIWQQVDDGKLTVDQAREQIVAHAGGIENPDWYNEGNAEYQAVLRDKTYTQNRPPFQGSKVTFEVAPDPRNKQQKSRWDALNQDQKNDISHRVAWKIAAKALASFGDENMKGELHQQMGGWLKDTNPSLSIWFNKRAAGTKIADFARIIGYALNQMGMMRTSPKPFDTGRVDAEGKKIKGAKMGAIQIKLNPGMSSADIHELYTELRTITGKRNKPYINGHTTADGVMIILHDDAKSDLGTEDLAQRVSDRLFGRFSVGYDHLYADFPAKGKDNYGFRVSKGKEGEDLGLGAEPSVRARADQLRAESGVLLEQLIGEAEQGKLSPARYGQPAANGGVAGQGRPGDRQLGRVDVTGTHYSREQRKHLTGGYFGTGLAGEEGKRLKEAKDTRLHSRLYAYVNEGQGVFPEAGVGAYAHTVKLDNLYDIKADPLGIRQKTRDPNDRESLILDAGFDGYYAPGVFGRQGVAILMGGAATRGVTPTDTVAPAVNVETAPKTERRTDLPMGKMTGAEWKKLEPRATDLEDGKMYYRDAVRFSPPRWYFSPLENAFESAPDKVFGQAAQVKLWLAGNKSKLGLKDDEIFWTGINDWLDLQGKAKVGKADVLGYLAGNGVQVQEVMKGVQGYNEDDPQLPVGSGLDVINATDGATGYEVTARNGRVIGRGRTEADAIADAYSGNPEYWENAEATKFGQYTLPGGENYRELLLTLPAVSDNAAELRAEYQPAIDAALERGDISGTVALQKERDDKIYARRQKAKNAFRSAHWEEPNILAHIRMNDRTDADGAKVLFVEEIQSDYGQEGKKTGFTDPARNKKRDALIAERTAIEKAGGLLGGHPNVEENRTRVNEINSTLIALGADTVRAVPAAPFVTDTKSWVALAVKRIMAYAAANGYAKVAFINGEQSADRYDLSKQVDRIAIGNMPGGNYQVVARKNGDVVIDKVVEGESGLEAMVGKEIAERFLAKEKSVFEGLDLKIGGTGMVTFYDRIVPQVVSDQLKKVGGKMETVLFGDFKSKNGESDDKLLADLGVEVEGRRPSGQTGFSVTPKMAEPLPLFSPARAQTETPEFKAWFGDWDHPKAFTSKFPADKTPPSMAMDWENNRPLVLFHATNGDFNTFETGRESVTSTTFGPVETSRHAIFTTPDSKFAESYLKNGGGQNVMPVYMDIKAPMDLRNNGAWNYADELVQNGFDNYRWPNRSDTEMWEMFDDEMGEAFVAAAKKAGYDGAIMFEVDDNDKMVEVYVAFDPTQIKSAIGNNGQFDPENPDIRKSTSRIIGASTRPYSQDHTDFFKRVGRTIDEPSFLEKLGAMRSDFGKKMATGIVDQFRGLKDLGPGGMQAYMLSRLSKGASGAFDALLHHGKLRLRDNVYDADTSGGFVDRLGIPLNGELEDFMWWVAANRADTLAAQGKENLFSPQDIAAGKSLATGQTTFDYQLPGGATTHNRALIYKDALRIFNEFNKNTLDMAEQSGLIDGASRPYWENQFYVPFYRVSEEDNEFIGSNIKSGLVRQRAFQKLKGGTDKLNSDLLSNTLLNWSHLIDASAKNRAAKASLQAAEQAGVAQKVAPDMASYAQSNGALLPPGTKKTVWYMDNGQKQEYKVTDPFVMTAITGLEYAGMRNPIMDTLSKFKHWLTVGVTASPAFKVRNLIRDSLQAIGASELGYNPVTNVVKGFKASNRASQDYVSALAGGGLIRFGTMLEGSESARVRQLIKSGVKDSTILNSEGKLQQFYDRYLEPTVAAYNEIGNRGEEINRMALYKQLVAQGRSHAEASLLARDLMDFSMQGSFNTIRFLTQIVPFMNARLQGMYKLGRAAKDDPRKLAIVTGATALFSIALMMASDDDDDWKKREDWDRDNFWWFKIGDTAWRIPKPFEVGAVATVAERSVELMLNDEMNGERYRKILKSLLLNNLSMNPVPQAIKPIVDLYANKDSFTGRPIENMSMQRLDPAERYTANTSLPARAMSASIGGALSPVQVDHVVRGYFSWLGTFVVGGADMLSRAISNEPTRPTMDYLKFATQGIGQEIGSGGSRYITQMYEQANELEQAHATWNHLKREGRIEEAREYMAEHADELKRYKPLAKVKEMESKLNERIRAIERSNIDPDQKKTQIDNVKKMKDQVARRVAPGVD